MKDFVENDKDKKIDFVALYEKHKRKGASTTLLSLFAMGLSGCFLDANNFKSAAVTNTGNTGVACSLLYDDCTGRLRELDAYDESQFNGDII